MRTKGEIANTGFLQQLDDHMRKKEISIKESAEESRRRMREGGGGGVESGVTCMRRMGW